jgi:hypothetical protein
VQIPDRRTVLFAQLPGHLSLLEVVTTQAHPDPQMCDDPLRLPSSSSRSMKGSLSSVGSTSSSPTRACGPTASLTS